MPGSNPNNPSGSGIVIGEGVDVDVLQLSECIAVGCYKQITGFCVHIDSICQRPENPCIVDIEFSVCGPDGEYEFDKDLTLFSVASIDGKSGEWHVMKPISTDGLHNADIFEVSQGHFKGNYVIDMCDHISSFFSEAQVAFRLTIRPKIDLQAALNPPTNPGSGGGWTPPPGSPPPGSGGNNPPPGGTGGPFTDPGGAVLPGDRRTPVN